ncbi:MULTISPECIES: hypothetical protein [Aequorivita]|uniref:Tetratricopeptide repeat protein n=2 Tax=Aequorivita TaxID=153265 RepID=A0AB35YYF6_9FLAO|nr:hypothetical protein [Aequorivita sp. Ant34-E75]WGF93868.1 hypothetical protein QCQ61_06690 [Aequorivita sp. Ant34-E75]
MKIENYTYLLANPQKVTSEDLNALSVLIKKYPYFQSARALQLKGLKNQDSFLYNDALKLTAAHTTDRDILFEYITSEKFIQNEISQTILQHDPSVAEIKVEAENVSEQISLEIDKQLKAEMQKAEDILNPELFQRKVTSVSKLVEKKDEQNSENAEETLHTNKPLAFTKNDTHSFAEWLKLTKAKPINRAENDSEKEKTFTSENITDQDERERKFELIDKFIQEKPKIIPSEIEKKAPKQENVTLENTQPQPSDSLMTETLAKVYLQQKNYKKAIQAYKILILKNPEKSGFFADQIRAIEKLINTEQS